MVNTYFKMYSTCSAITQIQIKSVLRFHPSQAEWLPSTNTRVDLGKGGDLYVAVHTSDNTGIKPTELPRGPASPLLGMNPKDSRSAHYRNTCTPRSLLRCAYQLRHGSSLDVPQQMNG